MQSTYDLIIQFIGEEQSQLETHESNYFGFVFGEVTRYYWYLSIMWPRYRAVSRTYVQAAKAMAKQMIQRDGSGKKIQELRPSDQQTMQLQLELESIFIFTSILLGRIAAATVYYFGTDFPPLKSFKDMAYDFETYREHKRLSQLPQGMLDKIRWLYINVIKFRNRLIVHKDEGDDRIRSHFGITWYNNDDEAVLNVGILHPKSNEKPSISEKPGSILKNLGEFLQQWIGYLRANRSQRNIPTRAQ